MKRRANILKILRLTGWTLLCLLMLFFSLANSPFIQKRWVQGALATLSKELGNQITIEKIHFKLPPAVHLENVFVSDLKGDTLFYFQSIDLQLRAFNSQKRRVDFSYASIHRGIIKMGLHEGDSVHNYNFFIDYFTPPRDTTRAPIIWTLHFNEANLSQTSFHYFDRNAAPVSGMDFNPTDFRFDSLYAQVKKLKIIDDSLHFQLKDLRTVERSGFKIDHMRALCNIYDKGLEFDNLRLQLPHSVMGSKWHMNYEHWRNLSHFIDDVRFDGELSNTHLNLKDIACFNDFIKPFADNEFKIEGDIKGPISRLKFRNASIRSLRNTYLEGKFDLSGLPEIENTYLNFDISKLHSSPEELFTLLQLPLPASVARLGELEYTGRLNGFYTNFVAFGTLITDKGSLKTDLNLDIRNGLDKALYSGKLSSANFELGSVLNTPLFGSIGMAVELKNGKGLDPGAFSFEISGDINKFTLNNYPYKNIRLGGTFTQHTFKGDLDINDPHLELHFKGGVNLEKGLESSDFATSIQRMNLQALGLDTAETNIQARISLHTVGLDPDKIQGSLLAEDISVRRGPHHLDLEKLSISAQTSAQKRSIALKSTLMDVDIEGVYAWQQLPIAFQQLASNLLPGIIQQKENGKTPQNISFSIKLKETHELFHLFDPTLSLDNGNIRGNFNSETETVSLKATLNNFRQGPIGFGNIQLFAEKAEGELLKIEYRSGLQFKGNRFSVSALGLRAEVSKNQLSYKLDALNPQEDLKLYSTGKLRFESLSDMELFLHNIDLHIKGKDWELKDSSSIKIGQQFALRPLELHNATEIIEASYIIEGENKNIQIALQGFEMGNINGFLPDYMPDFFGVASGKINIQPANHTWKFLSDIDVQNFAINKDTVGTIQLNSERVNAFQNQLSCKIKSGIFDGLKINGMVGNENGFDAMNLQMKLPGSDVSIFNQFLPGVSQLRGIAEGDLNITGSFSKPLVDGAVRLKGIKLNIDYLNVPFIIQAEIQVQKNSIALAKGATLTDDKGKTAAISGNLKHENFSQWNYQVAIENMRDFHVLNTTKKDNDLFYGQAYADGAAQLFGTFDKFNLQIKAKTKQGSQVIMPIGDSEISGPAPYISFKSERRDSVLKKQVDVGFLNTMLIDVEVNPDTEIQLIFDEQTGDIIKGAGTGRLVMEVNEDGVFTMRGGIKVERGDYQFVAFNNRVNKRFFIQRGGTIMWDGDPMQARIDLVTYNLQNASPNPLLGRRINDQSGTPRQGMSTVQARSEIRIKGNLFSPEISFGLGINNLLEIGMNELSSVIQRIQNDYDEVSRQVFSLLVFGSFMTPTFVSTQPGGVDINPTLMLSNSIADLISSQVDAWLSQINDKWLVDFSLSNITPDQRSDMIFKLGRKFANNRFVVDWTYTNQAGLNNNSLNMEYIATKDGRFRLKAFSRNQAIYNNASLAPVHTIGVGFFYRKEFNAWKKWELISPDSLSNDSLPSTTVSDSMPLQSNRHSEPAHTAPSPNENTPKESLIAACKYYFREEDTCYQESACN